MPTRRARPRTRDQWVSSLRWNIADAREALQNAVAMSDWAGARKYVSQLEKLERQLHDAESGPHTISGASGSRSHVATRARRGRRA